MPDAPKPQQFTYADQPLLNETFADSLHTMVWDGQTLRVEFCVTRYPDLEQNKDPRATRHPVSRMVLNPAATVDLYNRLKQTVEALTKAGVFRDPAQGGEAPQGQPLSQPQAMQLGAVGGAAGGAQDPSPDGLMQPRNGLI